jgi:hypothetical protein
MLALVVVLEVLIVSIAGKILPFVLIVVEQQQWNVLLHKK